MAARTLVLIGEPEDMATAADTRLILKAIGEVSVAVAGLRSDVTNLEKSFVNLSAKLDRVDAEKAARQDVSAAEIRLEKSITELRVRTDSELSRKIGKEDFSVDAFDNVAAQLEELDKRTERLMQNRETDHALLEKVSTDVSNLNTLKADHDLLAKVSTDVSNLNTLKERALGAKWVIGILSGAVGAFVLWLGEHVGRAMHIW